MDISIDKSTSSSLNRGYLIALTGVMFWSWTGILISYLLKHYPLMPMTLAVWRDLFVTGALIVGLWLFKRTALHIEPRQRWMLVLYGVSLTVMNVTWTFSVALNGAAVSTVMVYASPGITALAARVFFKERVSVIRIVAFAGSLAGCVLVAKANDPAQWNLNAGGILVGLASAFGFTFYSMMGKVTSQRKINSWTATLSAFTVAAIALLPIAAVTAALARATASPLDDLTRYSLLSLGTQLDGWLILLILAVIPTIGGFGLYTASLGHLSAGTANLIATLEPVLTTLLAYLLLRESLNTTQLLGGAFIVASVISLRLEER
jgi:drug/metabolite transporter (DMT)-like permease